MSPVSDDSCILFFDGVCGVCNALINFLLLYDKKEQITFAPLQGETAREQLSDADRKNLSSLVVLTSDNRMLTKSRAIFYLASLLPIPWCWLKYFRIVPHALCDFFYTIIAACRYRITPRWDSCRVPRTHEHARFLR